MMPTYFKLFIGLLKLFLGAVLSKCQCHHRCIPHTSSLMMVALLRERNAEVIFLPRSARTILAALSTTQKNLENN